MVTHKGCDEMFSRNKVKLLEVSIKLLLFIKQHQGFPSKLSK